MTRQDGFHEVEPGVYAPKVAKPPPMPRKPFQFNDEAHVKDELHKAYQHLSSSNEDGMLRFRHFDR